MANKEGTILTGGSYGPRRGVGGDVLVGFLRSESMDEYVLVGNASRKAGQFSEFLSCLLGSGVADDCEAERTGGKEPAVREMNGCVSGGFAADASEIF